MIENRGALCGHGDAGARGALLDVAEAAIGAVHPDRTVPAAVSLSGDRLSVGDATYDLSTVDRVLVVAAGKGALAAVEALDRVLGDRIDAGVAVEKDAGGRSRVGAIEVLEAGHPLPDERSREAADRVLDLAESAGPADLAVVAITGGASALLAAPADEVSLADLRAVTADLLSAGAPIEDVNAVRKHLSSVKGGRLASALAPARVAGLVVIDEVAGEPWGPAVPDPTTYGDAIEALERHGLWADAPAAVRERLAAGRQGDLAETPASLDRARTAVLADGADACEAARDAAADLGYAASILSTAIEGESREVGTCLAGIARECAERGRPVEPPCVLVSGGETTVTVDDGGEGGPNQEFALSAARSIAGLPVTALAVDTDGTDGPTDLAGGLVGGETLDRAAEHGVDIEGALRAHDAAPALRALGDPVVTGPTGTNVMDLRLFLVRPRE